MKKEITVSLIISTYNWPEALELCLKSILDQTMLPSEVIIADDGSDERTLRVINQFIHNSPFPIFHEWHEDKGFRKAIVLNRAIKKSSSPYIIQIDGDIITNSHFIEDHLSLAENGCFIRGTRVMLNPKITNSLFESGKLHFKDRLKLMIKQPANAIRFNPLFAHFFSRKELSGRRVKGCNMSFWREDLISINGYDNTLQGWGHEDEELSWRLINLGKQKKIIKFSAIAYHIYHKYLSRNNEPYHLNLLQNVQDNHTVETNNGLKELDG